MKRVFLGFLFLSFVLSNFLSAQELTLDEVKKKASKVTKEFESKLKKELKDAKREGGIKAMTEYCINDSKKVLEKMNNEYNPKISIKRISLNNRNKEAKPLDEEVNILKAFDLIQKSDAYEPEQIVQIISDTKYKVYSPIQMNSRDCKKCHGLENKVNKESQQKFYNVYKNKKGFGHKSGDIRGAVVVTISK